MKCPKSGILKTIIGWDELSKATLNEILLHRLQTKQLQSDAAKWQN